MGAPGAAGAPAGRPATKRQSRTYLLVAVVAAALAFVVFLSAIGGTGSETAYVARTKQPVLALAVLTENDIEIVSVPVGQIEENAIQGSSEAKVKEQLKFDEFPRTQYPLDRRQQLRSSFLSYDAAIGVQLLPEERLISIQANVGGAIGGQLRVGDTVDVIWVSGDVCYVNSSFPTTDDDQGACARYIVDGASIVALTVPESALLSAAGEQTAGADSPTRDEIVPGDPVPGIYTVKVTMDAAARLALAEKTGSLYLVYRGEGATPVDEAKQIDSRENSLSCAHTADPTKDPIGRAC